MKSGKAQKKVWEKTEQSLFLKKIKEVKEENIEDFFKKISGSKWSKIFKNKDLKKVLICADERTVSSGKEFKIGIAGQTILCDKKDRENFIKKMKGKIHEVRSHSGCGAAGVAFKNFSEKNKKLIEKEAISLGFDPKKFFSDKEKSEADELGLLYSFCLAKKIKALFSHSSFKKMRGEKEFHDARIIFWSSHSEFDPVSLGEKKIPPHFLANCLAFGVGEKYAKKELEILSGIALGDHGFGSLFTSENPLFVISVAKNKEDAKKMNEKAKKTLKNFSDRVRFFYI